MASYDAISERAKERAEAREREQKRVFREEFQNHFSGAWFRGDGTDNDGSSSSHSMTANPGGTVVNIALPPHLQAVTRARAVRSDTPP